MSEHVPSLDELFGVRAPESTTTAGFPSRRELRAAVPAPRAAGLTASGLPSRRELRAGRQHPARTAARPAHRRRSASPLRAAVTLVAVGGLLGVMGLPAYASLSVPEREPDAVLASVSGLPQQPVVSAPVANQTLQVGESAAASTAVHDDFGATSPEDLANRVRDALRAANNSAYLASGARELGDDYPWFYELSSDQGGGLSPLNYYYRECVDFVAWRLNRDAGYTTAPFKWVWSNLTPGGGDGSQWRWAWESKGWPVSDVPIPGSVAVIGHNHVAYVKQVNADGTVLLEEYNYNYSNVYGQRTVPASQASAYLYPPS